MVIDVGHTEAKEIASPKIAERNGNRVVPALVLVPLPAVRETTSNSAMTFVDTSRTF